MRRRFIAIGLFVLLFALGWWAGRGRASSDLYARLDTFIEILHKVEENYVEPVEPQRLIRGAVHGMLRDLDPYSAYVESRAEPARGSAADPSGPARTETKAGSSAAPDLPAGDVGLTLGARDNAWVIVSPTPGSPADLAGVRAGDILDQVDGRSTTGWMLRETEERLRGTPGSKVRLTLVREGEETPWDVTLTRARAVRIPRAEGRMLEKGIAFARLPAIDDSSARDLRQLLRRLRGEGATRLVLDLRGCALGTFRQGANVAQLFLPRGAAITLARGRSEVAGSRWVAAESAPLLEWPVVLIVDNGSAGAAEIVAGALQDDDRTLLLGRTTFGRASSQSEFPLEGGAASVRITTTVQLTPSGRPISSLAVPDFDDDEESPDSTAIDSAARRTYPTHSGRAIRGGGGIRPDLDLADSTATAASTHRAAPGVELTDRWVRRALEVLRRAHAPRDVFAA